MRHGLHMFRQKTSREKENSLRELEGKTFRFVHPSPDAITHGRKVGESSGAGRHVGWGTSDGGKKNWIRHKYWIYIMARQAVESESRSRNCSRAFPAQKEGIFPPTQYLSRHRKLRQTSRCGGAAFRLVLCQRRLPFPFLRAQISSPRLPPSRHKSFLRFSFFCGFEMNHRRW